MPPPVDTLARLSGRPTVWPQTHARATPTYRPMHAEARGRDLQAEKPVTVTDPACIRTDPA